MTNEAKIEHAIKKFREAWEADGDPPMITDYLGDFVGSALETVAYTQLALEDAELKLRYSFPVQLEDYLGHQQLREDPARIVAFIREWDKISEKMRGPRFHDAREIGKGGFGHVLVAQDRVAKRKVVLKVALHSGHALPDDLRREAEVGGKLQHHNIAEYIGDTMYNQRPCLMFRYYEGGKLTERLKKAMFRDIRAAAKLARAIASGLKKAHGHQGKDGRPAPIIHRDLKPDNLVFDRVKESSLPAHLKSECAFPDHEENWLIPKIIDFGVAHLEGASVPTVGPGHIGTVGYHAPEQLAKKDKPRVIGPAADVWAVGVILYECLTGQVPYPNDSLLRDPPAAAWVPLPSLRKSNLEYPKSSTARDLETIIQKALKFNPEERYRDAGELYEDLDNLLTGLPIKARRASMWERSHKRLWRHRRLVAFGVSACFALALAIWLVVALVQGQNQRFAQAERNTLDELGIAQEEVQLAKSQAPFGLLTGKTALGHWDKAIMAVAKAREHAADLPARHPIWKKIEDLERVTAGGMALDDRDYTALKRLDDYFLAFLLRGRGRQDIREVIKNCETTILSAGVDLKALDEESANTVHAVLKPDALMQKFPEWPSVKSNLEFLKQSRIKSDLIAALDCLALCRRVQVAGRQEIGWIAPLLLAKESDGSPWRKRFREVLIKEPDGEAKAFAMTGKLPPDATEGQPRLALFLLFSIAADSPRRASLAVPFRKVYNHTRDDVWVNILLAGCLTAGNNRDWPAVVGHYRAALVARPKNSILLTNLGHALEQSGKDDEAIEVLEEVSQVMSPPPEALNTLGVLLNRRKREKEAEALLRRAIDEMWNQQKRTDPTAQVSLSSVLISDPARWGDALAACEAVLKDETASTNDKAMAHNNLGVIRLRQAYLTEVKGPSWRPGSIASLVQPTGINPLVALSGVRYWLLRMGEHDCGEAFRLDKELRLARDNYKLSCDRLGYKDGGRRAKTIDVLAGAVTLKSAKEWEALIGWNQEKGRHRAAALLAEKMRESSASQLAAEDSGFRLIGAVSAALVASGEALDAPRLDDRERTKWRDFVFRLASQDREHLEREAENPLRRAGVERVLKAWLEVPPLASLRDEKTLKQLSAVEQEKFKKLWEELRALRRKIEQR